LLSARLRSETSDGVSEASGKYVRKNGIELPIPEPKSHIRETLTLLRSTICFSLLILYPAIVVTR